MIKGQTQTTIETELHVYETQNIKLVLLKK